MNRPTSDWRYDRNDIKKQKREAYNSPGHTRSRAAGKGSERSDKTLNTGEMNGGVTKKRHPISGAFFGDSTGGLRQ